MGRKEERCKFGIHDLERLTAGDDSREFRVQFYQCRRCAYRGMAKPAHIELDPPPLMTRLLGRLES